jgi:hypothetical protein
VRFGVAFIDLSAFAPFPKPDRSSHAPALVDHFNLNAALPAGKCFVMTDPNGARSRCGGRRGRRGSRWPVVGVEINDVGEVAGDEDVASAVNA